MIHLVQIGNWNLLPSWTPSSRRVFEVKSFYKVLPPTAQNLFPWKSVWKPKVPTKVSFFLWTTALGKILMIDNLQKQWLVVIDWCCMCKRDGETIDHLLLHCPIARVVEFGFFLVWGCLGDATRCVGMAGLLDGGMLLFGV